MSDPAETIRKHIEKVIGRYDEALARALESRVSKLTRKSREAPEALLSIRRETEQDLRDLHSILQGMPGGDLQEVARRLGSAILEDRPFRDLSQLVSEECTRILGCQTTYVFVKGADGTLFDRDGFQTASFNSASVLVEPLVSEVLETRAPRIVNDPLGPTRGWEQRISDLLDMRNLIAFPIAAESEVLGAVVCVNKEGGFGEADTDALDQIAREVGLAFQKFRIQQETIRTKRFYEDLVSNAGQAILSFANGKITSWNVGAQRIFGYEEREVLQRSAETIIAEEERWRFATHLRTVAEGHAPASFESRGLPKDGEPLEILVTLSPLKAQKGIVGIISDVSERTRLQEQLIQSEKMAAVGQLISGIAHELNNPLAAVIGFTELVRDNPSGDPRICRDLEIIRKNGQRCKEIVSKLLRFARKEQTERLSMDLAQAVRETIALRENEMALRGVNLSLDEKATLPPVLGSPGQLQQVFLNLINNAFDAIVEHGAPGSIDVIIHRNDSMAMVDIRDSGPGIPKEMLSRIFDPFFTTKPTGSGTGLGLSVSFRIIENHGGLLQVRSEEGQGTTFRVQIPLPEAEALAPVDVQEVSTGESGGLKGKKVLVVDDEPDLRELIERALEMEGARVTVRDCVEDAFGVIQEEDWDLVLSDIITPGDKDGFDLYEEIQRTRPDLYRRVILMSGVMPSGEFQERLETSGAHLLSKPFTVTDLLDATREVLETPRRIPVTAPADL